ncbi:MAG: hypothetical protein QOI11_903 [Candidatus Eremiobacteraeota bacterium]|jgi:hypothetical protein|nr:hypothetical protein [Candidatus Eremiobacteraeota bacterium]
MMYDDDALDRALAALPLEEPPAGLHARIMAATVDAPVPAAALPGWELWLIAILSSLALWLAWLFVTTPHAVERLTFAIDRIVEAGGLSSASTLLWVAIGVSAAWWVTQISVPQPQHAQKIRPR